MALDPFDPMNTNQTGDLSSDPNFWRNLQTFGAATMQAANTYGPNGFLTYGAGPYGAIGAGLNAATENAAKMEQARQNAALTQQQGIAARQQNMLFPFKMREMQYELQALQNRFGSLNGQQNTNPNVGQNGQGGSSAGGTTTTPNTRAEISSNQPNFDLDSTISTAAKTYNVPENIIRGVIQKESSGTGQNNPNPNDGHGYMGINPITGKQLGIDINDPVQNIMGGARYLRQLNDKYGGNWQTTLAAYNWGPNRVDGVNGDLTKMPSSVTQDYIPAVMNYQMPQQNNAPADTQTAASTQLQDQINQAKADVQKYSFPILPGDQEQLKAAEDRLTQLTKEQADLMTAGPKKESETLGGTKADAQKNWNTMFNNLPIILNRVQEMRTAAPDASFGVGVKGEEGEPGWKQEVAFQLAPISDTEKKTANANGILEQRINQGVLPEIAPVLQTGGMRGNKFLESIVAGAAGLELSADPTTKLKQIDGLEENYVNTLKSAAGQARAYGLQVPSDAQLDAMVKQYKTTPESNPAAVTAQNQEALNYKTPEDVRAAFNSKQITRKQAAMILNQQFGMALPK